MRPFRISGIPHLVRNDKRFLFGKESGVRGLCPRTPLSEKLSSIVIPNEAKRSEESAGSKLKRNYILYLIAYIFILFPLAGKCQMLDSLSLDTMTGATSIEQAMKDPGNVIKLELSKKKLDAFPEEIRKLTNLQYLDLSKNKITSVPSWIGELKNLQFLILSKTKIDSLPPEFGDLTQLKWFIMNRSSLQSLPHSIGKLKELRYMDLWGSNLSYFPAELRDLSDNLLSVQLQDVAISNRVQTALKAELPNTNFQFTPACTCEQ